MSDAMERVLELVADGRLSATDAAPSLDALASQAPGPGSGSGSRSGGGGGMPGPDPDGRGPQADSGGAKFARIMVMEGGRRVVDLRIPTSLGQFALGRVPGLSTEQVSELRQAISAGRTGPLLEVEDPDGDGVKIILE
ncbi:MAG TPA: hypothetical protein VET90_08355 [Candidatus Binatus sp.]|nr:hypothetical protein [Candidatus Binatus sp.]